ncbi:pyridoxal phosphate-dependent aminotransferase [bacterium]|nr:pyridoxal phosphate-dependent aminotransferase [bacterium]
MPRFPDFASWLNLITGSIFEKFQAKMAAHGDNLVKLHIGDTYLPPSYRLPIEPDVLARHRDFNRYCDTFGIASLREVLAEKLLADNELPAKTENVLVTCGASNALSAAVMSLVEPGEEVMILTPAWPLFFGMVPMAGAHRIEVPFYTRLFKQPEMDICGYLEAFLTSKTVALYLNTPNNPSGKVLNRAQIEQVAEFAKEHRLWLISDEAYDGLTFDDLPHISVGSLPGMFEQTISVFTFSKSFMFAGIRLGFAVGSSAAITSLNKVMVHQIYSPSTVSQYMLVEPVQTRSEWLPSVQRHYKELRDLFVETLRVDFSKPEGTYFIFFPADKYLKGRSYENLIGALLDSGVSIAPGDSFGEDFANYVRLCFTGEPPAKLEKGIERMNLIFSQC